MENNIKIGVLGAGTWGMALARMLSNMGYEVTVWSALEREVEEYSATRIHPNLPGMAIPDEIIFTKEIEVCCKRKNILLFAVPSVFVRGTAAKARPFVEPGQVIVDVAKGLEPKTFLTMSEIIRSELEQRPEIADVPVVALSGPTHAEEVAKDMPTAITAASKDMCAAEYIQRIFSNNSFRVYTNNDIRGVELCGALKNVIALASGISLGLGYGDNTKAALITRGMVEICRLGRAYGCCEETFYGLAGIGDLIVTATSVHSRNNRCGYLIGSGKKPKDAIREVGMVVEGVFAIPAAIALSEKYGIEAPIISAADAIINHGADPLETVNMLMGRKMKSESKND